MKHLKKFEDKSHLDFISQENEIRRHREDLHRNKLEDASKEKQGKYLPKLASEKSERENINSMVEDRKQIVDRVIEGLRKDSINHPGYQSFKDELLSLLSEFPKE